MTLLLLNFKNYYDRKGISYDTVNEYLENSNSGAYQYNYDFNPNDGVWSSVFVNTAYDDANYLLVIDEYSNTIISRWYVLDATRKRAEQYSLKLLRDVIADYRDIVLSAPTFIEKATVRYGNPLLFNPEEGSYNQIKTKETLLRDMSLCPWIVGYIKSDTEATTVNITSRESYYAEYAQLSDIPYYDYVSAGKFVGNSSDIAATSIYMYYQWLTAGLHSTNERVKIDTAGNVSNTTLGNGNDYAGISASAIAREMGKAAGTTAIGNALSRYYANNAADIEALINSEFNYATQTITQSFLSTYPVEGTTIKVGDKYYSISRNTGSVSRVYKNPTSTTSGLFTGLKSMAQSTDLLNVFDSADTDNFQISTVITEYDITLKEVQVVNAYTATIPGPSIRNHLLDAPYDMFAIPYPTDFAINAVSALPDYDITGINADASMGIATAISKALGDRLIDLQLLPYCPIPDLVRNSIGYLYYPEYQFTVEEDYNFINYSYEGTTYPVSIMFWPKKSTFSTQISRVITKRGSGFKSDPIAITVEEPKIEAMCDFYRLCSPNYNGQFEFNAVKNEGVDYFNVGCTYKPYSPYIRVAPNFKGLYGGEYGDARGLICGGDFSLATITDAWSQYELNNKNYLNAFDRQIESMEFQHKYQRIGETINAVMGTAQGAVSGGMMGSMVGGGYGAAAGAIIGGTASAIGGIVDVSINDKLRNEALDYTKDNFGYQLGNIRALPYTLNRVSAFNITNRLFPVLEYYTCTETEKQALRDKIKYNGMSVGVIGTVAEYLQDEESYIKGRVIRVNDLGDDYHIASALAEEIYKGVFI